jgi:multidrug efflux pump
MGIWPLPNANSLDVIKAVRKEMAAIQAELPSGLDARIAYDATNYIDNAIREVIYTLSETLAIVVVSSFSFSVPFDPPSFPCWPSRSRSSVVFLMQVFGFTINLLTLLAIVLAVGLVVDDAIVMVENVERHLGMGKHPLEAALTGCPGAGGPHHCHDGGPGGGLYAPIGIQGGLTGALFREFAFTLAGAVIISTVVALTLSPMMSSKLLAPGMSERGFAGKYPEDFKRFTAFYGRLLNAP